MVENNTECVCACVLIGDIRSKKSEDNSKASILTHCPQHHSIQSQ